MMFFKTNWDFFDMYLDALDCGSVVSDRQCGVHLCLVPSCFLIRSNFMLCGGG